MSAHKPPLLLGPSGLTGRYYIVTSYTQYGDGRIVAHSKHDVTEAVEAIIADAALAGDFS